MPYPKPDDPDYCKGSRTEIRDYDENKIWFRCPKCGRLIAPMGKTRRFFDHVSNKKRARRGDAVQEGLTAHGLNRKEEFGPRVFTTDIAPAEMRSV
jgi:predicted RNA-binding Zn-ribbon protein involved in translation (DUF1610 family)